MEYTLNGTMSVDDFLKFHKFYYKHSPYRKFRLIFYSIIFIFLCITIIVNNSMEMFIESYNILSIFDFIQYILSILYPVIILFALIFFGKFIKKIIYKKMYTTNKILNMNQNIMINEKRISILTEVSNNDLIKSDIYRIQYNEDSIYIYIGSGTGYIIKKQWLSNENDFEDMKNFIKIHYNFTD